MKLYPLFFLLILFFFSCKKELPEALNAGPQASGRDKFIDTVSSVSTSTDPVFAANTTANNFYVVQKTTGSNYSLFKTNADINVLYTKTLNLGAGELMKIKGSQVSDDFYTLNATNNFTYTYSGQIINAYVYSDAVHDTIIHCDSISPYFYLYNNQYENKSEINLQNHTTLRKFDSNGNESWAKSLDGHFHEGNSLETDLYGNVYALTITKGGYRTKPGSQFTNSPVPYIDIKLDSNQFSLYKFDINGTQVFKKTFTNVYFGDPGYFRAQLAISANNISVSNANNLFIFDLSGTLVSSIKPVQNICYNYIISTAGNVNQQNLLIKGSIVYAIGSMNNPIYLVKFNQTSFASPLMNISGNKINGMDNKGNYYSFNESITKWESTNGYLQYSKQLVHFPVYLTVNSNNSLTDKFSNAYVFQKRANLILAYKLDSYGNFQ